MLHEDCEQSVYISRVQRNQKTWAPGICSLQSCQTGFDSFAHLRDKLAQSTDQKGTAGSLLHEAVT